MPRRSRFGSIDARNLPDRLEQQRLIIQQPFFYNGYGKTCKI
jgi:hypothetical protein